MSIKQIFKTIPILAVVFWIAACGDNEADNRTVETLKIKEIWQGTIPEKFQEALFLHEAGECGNDILEGDTFLLLPEKISTTQTLHVELYGCWSGGDLAIAENQTGRVGYTLCSINCNAHYKGLDINHTNKTLSLAAEQYICPRKKDSICVTSGDMFEKQQAYDINGSWKVGELRIVIRNPNDQNLTSIVIIE